MLTVMARRIASRPCRHWLAAMSLATALMLMPVAVTVLAAPMARLLSLVSFLVIAAAVAATRGRSPGWRWQPGGRVVIPGFGNKIAATLARLLPRGLVLAAMDRRNRERLVRAAPEP